MKQPQYILFERRNLDTIKDGPFFPIRGLVKADALKDWDRNKGATEFAIIFCEYIISNEIIIKRNDSIYQTSLLWQYFYDEKIYKRIILTQSQIINEYFDKLIN
jgi:hypothetical protein